MLSQSTSRLCHDECRFLVVLTKTASSCHSLLSPLNKAALKTPLLSRFPGDAVAALHHHPACSVFSTTHIHLSLHHGPWQPQTSARHHWSSRSSYGELVLCQTSLSDPVNCSDGWCTALWGDCQHLPGDALDRSLKTSLFLCEHAVLLDHVMYFGAQGLNVWLCSVCAQL